MKKFIKLSTLILLIFSCILLYGFIPASTILKKENQNFANQIILQDQINNNNIDAIDIIDQSNISDNIMYTINQNKLNAILSKYKEKLIKKIGEHINNNDTLSASNLLGNAINLYKDDINIHNLITINNITNNPQSSKEQSSKVDFLFFNTLMAFPEKALNHSNNLKNIYDEEKLTINEFSAILNELYKNNYIIVDIFDIIKEEDNIVTKKDLSIPQNKKPVILCFDNISYKSNYQNLGEIDKLIIDRNNNIATYTTKKSIQDRIQYDNEFVVILENFINSHPDFSHNNARGIIFLAGEDGILGYNTNHKNASCKTETKKVSEIVKKLKSLGWRFGCNNYTYKNETTKNEFQFTKELSLWQKEISSIIGNTCLYSHPYGDTSSNESFRDLLLENHFKIFFQNQDTEIILNNKYCTLKKTQINGNTLRNNHKQLAYLFDCEKIYDHTHRTVTFYNKKGE